MKKNLNYFIVGFLLVLMVGIGMWAYMKKASYNVELPLTNEQRAEYESKVVQMDQKLKESRSKGEEKPDIDYFIEKARYQEYLGHYSDAIDTLLGALRYYEVTSAGWNNLAKLYDKVGEYALAAQFYNKLLDTFNIDRYYYELAWDYYHLGKLEDARNAYGRYTQLTAGYDNELYKLLYSSQPK